MRFRSHFNRSGTRAERWSLLVVVAAVIGGILGGIELANRNVGSIGSARWPLFVIGLVLMATGIFVRQWAVLTLAGSSPSTCACTRIRRPSPRSISVGTPPFLQRSPDLLRTSTRSPAAARGMLIPILGQIA